MYVTRHSEMIKDVHMASPIMVIGVGSIGSYVIMSLAKLGFTNILVIDDGIVDEENIAPQLYRMNDIGRSKVDALKVQVKAMTGTEIRSYNGRFENTNEEDRDNYSSIPSALRDIMHISHKNGRTTERFSPFTTIMACDSMKARKEIFEYIEEYFSDDIDFYVDARMAIEFLTIYSFRHTDDNFKFYRETLFSDENAVQEACTNKAIAYTSAIAGGLVSKCVLDLLKGKHKEGTLRTIQFDIGSLDMMVM